MLCLSHNKRRRLHCLVKAVVTAHAPLNFCVLQMQVADVAVSFCRPPLLSSPLLCPPLLPANALVSSLLVKAWWRLNNLALSIGQHSHGNSNAKRQVLQLDEKVLQLFGESSIVARLSTVESEIRDLKSAIFLKEGSFEHENRKQKAEGEIRTRVVASTGP